MFYFAKYYNAEMNGCSDFSHTVSYIRNLKIVKKCKRLHVKSNVNIYIPGNRSLCLKSKNP